MRSTYTTPDWQRLGRYISRARRAAGFGDTTAWASAVGRSTRSVLGLERGESQGPKTLEAIEVALGWHPGACYEILDGVEPSVAISSEVSDAHASRTDEPRGRPLERATDADLLDELARRLARVQAQLPGETTIDDNSDGPLEPTVETLRDPERLERWLTDQLPEGESTLSPRAVVQAVVDVTRLDQHLTPAEAAEAVAAGARVMDAQLRAAKKGQSSGRQQRARQDADATAPDAPGNETGS